MKTKRNNMKNPELSRITIDISPEDHKRFKIFAAIEGKSMRKLIIEAIQNHITKVTIKE
jgi:predicted HicB family RNase H-like nuclease